MTFWTGNHPLARGEGDLAANPDLKQRRAGIQASASRALARSARAALLSRGLRLDRRTPARLGAARRAQGVLQRRSGRAVVCGTLRQISCGVGRAVSARPCRSPSPARGGCGRARAGRCRCSLLGGVVDSCRPRVFSPGAVPHARHRPRADCFCRRAGGPRPSPIVTTPPTVLVVVPTYNERDNLPVLARGVLAHARLPDAGRRRWIAGRHGRSRRRAGGRVSGPGRGHAPHRASAGSGARTSTACRRRSRSPTSISSARWTPTCRTIPSTCRRSSPRPPTTTS